MQRKHLVRLAALPLILASGVASAQSAVTLYGRLNITLERQKAGSLNASGMVNNASRVGVKGSEDLGGGLTAGFQLEHGFNADTGQASQSAFWARQSEVNLAGGFGMLRLGNFTSEAYFATADYVSMHNHDTGTSSDAFYAYIGRNRDKIAYRLPAFGNLNMEFGVGMRDKALGDSSHTLDFAANYDAGPLHLGLGYEKNDNVNQFAVRGLYEMGAFTFGGYVQRDKNAYGSGNRTTLRLSGMYTMGANELHLNVGRAGKYSNVPNSAASQFTVGLNHNLSKRTKVYTFYTKIADGNAALYGGDFSSLAVGVRHNF